MILAAAFVLLTLASIPISFVLLVSALVYIAASDNAVLYESVGRQLFGGIENYGLLSLPLFILLGELMSAGGIGRRLMAFAAAMLGAVRGGLAYICLTANLMMAAILGSTVAQITVMSRLAVPEMVKAGYPKDVSVAITAAAGLLAPIIPPSMIFIIFGVVAQVPIGDLFTAGIVPGLVIFLAFAGVIGVMSGRYRFPSTAATTMAERWRSMLDAIPAALIPVVIIGSILGGLASPTESAAIACLIALVVGLFVYREMTFADIGPAFVRTAKGAAVVLFLIATAQVFSWAITFENIPAKVAVAMQAMTASPTLFMLLVTAVLIFVGMIMDPIPAIIMIVPVLLPVATGVYGIDPIQFGMVVCINLTMGLLTPPVGTGLFTAALLNDIPAGRIAVLIVPFLLVVVAALILLVFFPILSLGLGKLI